MTQVAAESPFDSSVEEDAAFEQMGYQQGELLSMALW